MSGKNLRKLFAAKAPYDRKNTEALFWRRWKTSSGRRGTARLSTGRLPAVRGLGRGRFAGWRIWLLCPFGRRLCEYEKRLCEYIYVFDLPSSDQANLRRMMALANGIAVWGSAPQRKCSARNERSGIAF